MPVLLINAINMYACACGRGRSGGCLYASDGLDVFVYFSRLWQ